MMATKALLLAAVVAVASGDELQVRIAFSDDALNELQAANQTFALVREGASGGTMATVWARNGKMIFPSNTVSWNDTVQTMWMAQAMLKVGDEVQLGSWTKGPVYPGRTYVCDGSFRQAHLPDYPVTEQQYGIMNNWSYPNSFGLSQSVSFNRDLNPESHPIFSIDLLPHEHATMNVPSNNFYIFLTSGGDARTKVGTVVDTTTLEEITNTPVSFISFEAKEKSIDVAFNLDTLTFYKGILDTARK